MDFLCVNRWSGALVLVSSFYAPAIALAEIHPEHQPESSAESDVNTVHNTGPLAEIDKMLKDVEQRLNSRTVEIKSKDFVWSDLANFQNRLYQAMAVDPALVPQSAIPHDFDPVQLTRSLKTDLKELKRAQGMINAYKLGEPWRNYVDLVGELFRLRDMARYRDARVLAKTGLLDERYHSLMGALQTAAGSTVELSVHWNDADRQIVRELLSNIRDEVAGIRNPTAAPLADKKNKRKSHGSEEASESSREPASISEPVLPAKMKNILNLVWILIPLSFVTGMIGGLGFRKRPQGRDVSTL